MDTELLLAAFEFLNYAVLLTVFICGFILGKKIR